MSLRRKTLTIFTVAIIVMVVVGYLLGRLIILNSFAGLEARIANQNVDRVLNALSSDIAALDRFAIDWAGWDDTYAFVESRDENYIQSNLMDETFNNIQLSVMLFVNASGEIVYGKAFDLSAQTDIPVPASLLQHISVDDPLLQHTDITAGLAGVLLAPEGLMVIDSRPILTSTRNGPSRGSLIVARFLDKREIERLSTITVLSLTMARFDDPQAPADFLAVRPLSTKDKIVVQPLSAQTIAGYTVLEDIYGEPSVTLRIDMPRDIYQEGIATTGYLAIALLAAGLVFAVLLLLLLDRLVLSRLARLDAAVNGISISSDLSARVPAQGNDELAGLAYAINRMLWALQQSEVEVKDATARYRQLFEEVQTGVLVIDASTRAIVDANSAAVQMLGASKEQIIGQPCRVFCSEHIGECAQGHDGRITTPSEGELLTASGAHMSVVRATSGVVLKGHPHLLESLMDITGRKQHEKWLTHLAYSDPLTDVANRRTLEEALERVMDEARQGVPSALLLLDADNFKPVNDGFGHTAGDQVLVGLTRIVQQNLRSTDLLARLGGDEFAVLMAGTTVEVAWEVAERVRSKIEATTIDTQESSFRLTVSIGAIAVDGNLSTRELMVQADQAMHHAKERGRNRIEVE